VSSLILPRGPVTLVSSERGTAWFSEDNLYRYKLTRRWASGGLTLGTIGQNPSTADHQTDDMTITKEIEFGKRLGCSALVKVNLGAFKATNPNELLTAEDPVGRFNSIFLGAAATECDILVAAWGALDNRIWAKFRDMVRIVKNFNGVKCFGKTKSGAPRHTSRIAHSTPLEDWRP